MANFILNCQDMLPEWMPASMPPLLQPGSIHVWLIETKKDDTLIQSLNLFLSSDEITRKEKFKRPDDRLRFTFAHALKRILIGAYLNTDPRKLIFEKTENQKPHLANVFDKLHFNFSHSHDKIIFVASTNYELGCDVEYIRPDFKFNDFMNRFYSPTEIEFIQKQPNETLQREMFFRFWSRKESWLKATGIGVFNDLENVDTGGETNSFHIQNESLNRFNKIFFIHTFKINDSYSSIANDKMILPLQFFKFDFDEINF